MFWYIYKKSMGADVMYPTLEQLHGNLRESFLLLTSQYAWVDGLWVGAVMCGAQHPVAHLRAVGPCIRWLGSHISN